MAYLDTASDQMVSNVVVLTNLLSLHVVVLDTIPNQHSNTVVLTHSYEIIIRTNSHATTYIIRIYIMYH